MKFIKSRKLNIIFTLFAVISLCTAWIIAYYAVGNDYVIPSFGDTFASLFECFTEASFWLAFLNTVLRTVVAFLISFALALVSAVLSKLNFAARAFINPVIVMLRTLPTLAVILVLLIWSNAKIAPVIVTVLVLFPLLHTQILTSADGVDCELCDMLKAYNVPYLRRLIKVYVPLISSDVLPQIGANLSLGLKVMISAEVLSNTYSSLGGLMQTARAYLEMPRLAALTLTVIFIGLLIDLIFSLVAKINAQWQRGTND